MTAPAPAPALRRELGLRDLTLFTITSIVGTRWVASAAHAGPGSITLWILAAVFFVLPLARVVGTLSARYPGAGGLYLWTRNDYGPWHGFLAFWLYWTSMAVWFPGAAMFCISAGLYSLGPRFAPLAANRACVVTLSLAAIWIALGTNLVGVRTGKWTQNIGGYSTWVLAVVLSGCAFVVWSQRGAATPIYIVPALRWDTVSFWASIAYAMSGLELAGMMSSEIRDPERTLPRAATLASIAISVFYVASTLSLLTLMRPAEISEISGLSQAGTVIATAFRIPWIAPLIAILVLASAVGQFGGIGSAVSRMPLAAGVDRLLPSAFGRVHPRWATPHVSILTLGCVASFLLVAMQFGDTMQAAYQAIVSLMVIGGFVPYLYIFGSAWKAGRRVSAISGLGVTILALVSAVVPSPDVGNVILFEGKLAAGALAMVASAWLIYRRHT